MVYDAEGEASVARIELEEELRVTKERLSGETELREKEAQAYAGRLKEVQHASRSPRLPTMSSIRFTTLSVGDVCEFAALTFGGGAKHVIWMHKSFVAMLDSFLLVVRYSVEVVALVVRRWYVRLNSYAEVRERNRVLPPYIYEAHVCHICPHRYVCCVGGTPF